MSVPGALSLLLALLSGNSSALPRRPVAAQAIVPGHTLVMLAEVGGCGPDQGLPSAQLFISTDQGKTWLERGPAIEGSQFRYAATTAEGVWIAGLHTAEGPGIDPFVLVPQESSSGTPDWTRYVIHEGPAELQAVMRAKPGELSALVKHIDVRDPRWRGPTFLHESSDGGRTWKTVGPLKGAAPAQRRFAPITKQGPVWRIADRKDGGFDVQRRTNGAWQTTAEFPARPCE